MSKKSFWRDFGEAFNFVVFLIYGTPIIMVVLGVLIANQFIFGAIKQNEYKDNSNVLFTSNIYKSIADTAESLSNKNVFSSVYLKESSNFGDSIKYVFKDNNLTAAEYDSFAKDEVTKLYNAIKDKTVVVDQIFGSNDRKKIDLDFYCPSNDSYGKFLGSATLMYYKDKGFDGESYQQAMNKTLIKE